MRLSAALSVVVLVAAVAPARAADPDQTAEAEARHHFARGSAYFKLGDFEQALAEFRAAFSLSQAPGLLFNMGQAARALGRYDIAAYYYRAYLAAVPDAPERGYVEERLRDMELRVSSSAPLRDPDARAAPPGERIAAPGPAPRDDHPGRGLRIIGLATAGAGVVLGATAVWFGLRASDASDQVSHAFAMGAVYDARLADLYADGRRDERIAVIGGAAAGAMVVGGAVLWYVGVRQGRRTHVAAAPASGGVSVNLSWAF